MSAESSIRSAIEPELPFETIEPGTDVGELGGEPLHPVVAVLLAVIGADVRLGARRLVVGAGLAEGGGPAIFALAGLAPETDRQGLGGSGDERVEQLFDGCLLVGRQQPVDAAP